MNAQLAAAGPQSSRVSIMAKLATVLRHSEGSTTNIESAMADASVSAQQVAATFGGTRELIVAMVGELSEQMSAPLASDSNLLDARSRLLDFAECVTDIYAHSHLRGLYRIAVTESIRHTGLGRDFYEAGPGRLTQRLADFLQRAQAQGALSCTDPQLLATHFLASLRAHLDVADTYAHHPAGSGLADRSYVRQAVDLFFNGIEAGAHRGSKQTTTARAGH